MDHDGWAQRHMPKPIPDSRVKDQSFAIGHSIVHEDWPHEAGVLIAFMSGVVDAKQSRRFVAIGYHDDITSGEPKSGDHEIRICAVFRNNPARILLKLAENQPGNSIYTSTLNPTVTHL